MTSLTFTSGNDKYTVRGADSYSLEFLGGNDILTIDGGDFTSADMGSGNDLVRAITGQADVNAGAGTDRYDIWSDNFTGDAGLDNDLINVRGGYNVFVHGGGGADRFNVLADVTYLALDGGDGNDLFLGNGHVLTNSFAAGGAGNDRFFGFASSGGIVPELQGEGGNDLYRFDPATAPYIIEQDNGGTDTVEIPLGAAYVLPTNVENLRVLAIAGSTSDNGTLIGNNLNNTIIAGGNDDQIQGLDGNDWLYGRGGNDLIDGGAGKNHLSGGDGNDQLLGGDLRDWLDGGSGDDTMSGGLGDDVYTVDGLGDSVLEDAGAGTDTLWSSAAFYNLPTNIENGAIKGSVGAELGGNSADNVLTGGAGSDTLNGYAGNDTIRGGGGNDTLVGGDGADSFAFNTVLNALDNVDNITDFVVVDDTVILDQTVFGAVGAVGTLAASAFFTGGSAHDADDRIVYDSANGNIYYDADGNGAGAAILFAHVTAGVALTNADFNIVA